MQRVVLNYQIDVAMCALFMVVLVATVFFGVRAIARALRTQVPTARESDYVALDALAKAS